MMLATEPLNNPGRVSAGGVGVMPDETPTRDAAPAPVAPDAPAEPRFTAWEDRVGLASAIILLVGCALPWYEGAAFLRPTREALIAAGLAALAVLLLVYAGGERNERLRRQVSLLLGLAAALDTVYVAEVYYAFHAGTQPRLGVVGHVAYLGAGLDLAIVGSLLLAWSGIPTRRPGPVAGARAAPVERFLRPFAQYGVPALVFVAAFSMFLTNVERPSIIDFDEAHYVKVGQNMTLGRIIDPAWAEPRPYNFEHPPVGKYFIAAGYWLVGTPHQEVAWPWYHDGCQTRTDCPANMKYAGSGCSTNCSEADVFRGCASDNPQCARDFLGWRLGSVFVGSLGVLGMYWIGLRLFRSMAAGLLSVLFLLSDNLYYLHARTAMLDIYAVGFALLGLGVFLGPSRWHKVLGGVFWGLGVASKHYALFVGPPLFALAYLTSGHTSRWMRFRDAVLYTIAVPFATYLVAYLPYLVAWTRMQDPVYAFQQFVFIHKEGFRWTYRAELDKPHPYVSRPWTWIPMRRPVFYFVGYDSKQNVGHIYAVGNPYVWWLGCVAILYAFFTVVPRWLLAHPRAGLRAAWEWLGRPFQFHRDAALLFGSLLFVAAYLPFFTLKRDPFNFYFLIAAPFFSLVLGGYASGLWSRGPPQRLLAIAMAVGAAAVFVVFHPVVAGTYISEQDFQFIMHLVPQMRQ